MKNNQVFVRKIQVFVKKMQVISKFSLTLQNLYKTILYVRMTRILEA